MLVMVLSGATRCGCCSVADCGADVASRVTRRPRRPPLHQLHCLTRRIPRAPTDIARDERKAALERRHFSRKGVHVHVVVLSTDWRLMAWVVARDGRKVWYMAVVTVVPMALGVRCAVD